MTDLPLISVIMNCHNSEEFLREAIDSVLNQTYKYFEVIFWDNCSTDHSAAIVKSYNDNRIKYYYASQKATLGHARNLAISKSNGEIIAFLDCDDLWDNNWLEVMSNEFSNDDELSFLFCRFAVFGNRKEKLVKRVSIEDSIIDLDSFIDNYTVGMSGACFRKSVLKDGNISFSNTYNLIEDYDFFIRIASYGKVKYLVHPYMHYRLHGNNLTDKSSSWTMELKDMRAKVERKERSYEHLQNHMQAINRQIRGYEFHDMIVEKKYFKALITRPVASFLYIFSKCR